MDDTKLRALERQYKLRVKTGCGTCRIRRVKCDEAKPECQRCTKTSRKCDGYAPLAQKSPSSVAASYRNSSFLSIPPAARNISRSPSAGLSDDANENRSFFYFRTRTLPQWTEFFDSEIWSEQILQLSHHEPAIKHGLLALSTLHERFERNSQGTSAKQSDYALVQYMQAVKHSNKLLTDHQHGKVPVEKVLLACIIFVCYENLAGNYASAAMHLQNGLRILAQHQSELSKNVAMSTQQDSVADVLFRFDFQAMTSDMSSPYKYDKSYRPACPNIPTIYTSTASARNDLVELLCFMMWIYGIFDPDTEPDPYSNPVFIAASTQLLTCFQAWVIVFDAYAASLPPSALQKPKTYAGITLLRIYGAMCQAMAQDAAGSEMRWDAHLSSFRTIVELSESLSSLSPATAGRRTSAPAPTATTTVTPGPLAPTPPPPDPAPQPLPLRPSPPSRTYAPLAPRPPSPPQPSFIPSFELSPIVPLFMVATTCRDPLVRRRAIALLRTSRRREGMWDSDGAAAVAAEYVRIEEGLDGYGGHLPRPLRGRPSSGASVGSPAGGVGDGGAVDVRCGVELPMGRIGRMEDVPEEVRVVRLNIRASVEQRLVRVGYVTGLGTINKVVWF